MKHRATIAAVVMGVAFAGCGGDDEKATTTPAARDAVETPDAPASAPSGLPSEFVECMAAQGYEVTSSDDIHSAPTQILQMCFGSLHDGGGAP
jgi:hypothetical protein